MKIFLNIKLKQILHITFFTFTLFILLILSKENFSSVSTSTSLFILKVFPSLFPFILFAEFVINTDIIDTISKVFGTIISKIFKVSKNATTAVIIGFLCGFPMGAKTVSKLYEDRYISKEEASKLLMLVNNCNPAFILSTIGIGIFCNISVGILLLISHYTASIITYYILSKAKLHLIIHKNCSFSNSFCKISQKNIKEDVFYTVKKSILNAFATLATILGFIILFNLISQNIDILLKSIPENIRTIISGMLEMTKGSDKIYNSNFDIYTKILLISFITGFSGFCIIFQIYSVAYKFSLKLIIISKFIQGILSCVISYILINFTNILDISTINVFSSSEKYISYDVFINNLKKSYMMSTIIIIIFLVILYFKAKKKVA